MGKEPSYPSDLPVPLGDLIKMCLNKDYKARPEIADILAHPYFQKEKKKTMMTSPMKLGLSLSGSKFKRTTSQSNQRVSANFKPLLPTKGKSVDKRDRDASSELDYNSLLKDLSRISATANDKPRLIRTVGMQTCSYSTKNGKISILKNGSVEIDLSAKKKKIVNISPEGGTVIIPVLRRSL